MQGRLYGMRGRELRRRVAELLEVFGLTAAAKRQAKTYSGGMRRRLDIATVLVHRQAVLFLDEPTTGLDPEGRADLWAVLTGLAADVGTTIVLTTHYLEEADQYAQTIAIVDRGRVVAQGTAEQLKSGLHGDSVLLESRAPARPLSWPPLCSTCRSTRRTAEGALARARVGDGPRALPGLLARVEAADSPLFRYRRPALFGRRLPAPRRRGHSARPKGPSMNAPRQTWVILYPRATCGQLYRLPVVIFMTLSSRSSGCCSSAPCSRRWRRSPDSGRQLHHVPDARRRDHDGDVLGELDRHGLYRGHADRRDGQVPDRAGRPGRDDRRHAGVPGDDDLVNR